MLVIDAVNKEVDSARRSAVIGPPPPDMIFLVQSKVGYNDRYEAGHDEVQQAGDEQENKEKVKRVCPH